MELVENHLYIHVKSEQTYVLLHVGNKNATKEGVVEEVCYKRLIDNTVWMRPSSEFRDRFIKI